MRLLFVSFSETSFSSFFVVEVDPLHCVARSLFSQDISCLLTVCLKSFRLSEQLLFSLIALLLEATRSYLRFLAFNLLLFNITNRLSAHDADSTAPFYLITYNFSFQD
jgi:hypothetical protein